MSGNTRKTAYRDPLVGFAAAGDSRFGNLRQAAHPGHLMPDDLLMGAKTVISFFLPFGDVLINTNRRGPKVSREWAQAYIDTNHLIGEICRHMSEELEVRGYRSAWETPTHNFDTLSLVSAWSHKHIAYICGLGSFGRHTMLITEQGCAGRFGSLVTDAWIGIEGEPRELFFSGCEGCQYCQKVCPVSALGENGLDKAACYTYLLEVDRSFHDLPLSDACGKCACGPCAMAIPTRSVNKNQP